MNVKEVLVPVGACAVGLRQHAPLMTRRARSRDELQRVAHAFGASVYLASLPVALFCTGSLARAEAVQLLDGNVFAIANEEQRSLSSLTEYKLFTEIINIREELQLAEVCSDGRYLKVWFVDDLKRTTGTQREDGESLSTMRIRLLLESQPMLHVADYRQHLSDVVQYYCREGRAQNGFRPLVLLNDLLRYWRTICLNHQERREDVKNAWRGRTVNLKFSQMVTVFSTVLAVVTQLVTNADELVLLCRLPPLDRLAIALDTLDDPALADAWPRILDIYEESLTWKDDQDLDTFLAGPTEEHVNSHAAELSDFLYSALTHHRIRPDFRRYLVL